VALWDPSTNTLTNLTSLAPAVFQNGGYLAYDTPPGDPVALWNAATPDAFSLSTANDTATDLVTSGDGTIFAMRAANTTEIRGCNLALFSAPAAPELETIPNRVAVTGIAIHPSGALTYEPFLTGAPPSGGAAVTVGGSGFQS
jgi:hypothetical protein